MVITYVIVMWLPFTTAPIKVQNTPTLIHHVCWNLLRLIFLSDLRKPCLGNWQNLSFTKNISVFEEEFDLINLIQTDREISIYMYDMNIERESVKELQK